MIQMIIWLIISAFCLGLFDLLGAVSVSSNPMGFIWLGFSQLFLKGYIHLFAELYRFIFKGCTAEKISILTFKVTFYVIKNVPSLCLFCEVDIKDQRDLQIPVVMSR